MSASTKKILGIVAALVVLAAAAGYFVYIPQLEKQHEERVAAFIQELPGDLKADSIKVKFLESSVAIKGLKGTTKNIDGSPIELDIAAIALGGINFNAENSPGVIPLADSFVIDGLAMKSETMVEGLSKPLKQDFSMERLEFKNIKGDYAGLRKAIKESAPLEKILELTTTFQVGKFTGAGYNVVMTTDIGPISVKMKSLSYADTSLLAGGQGEGTDMVFNFLGSDVFTLGRMGWDSYRMPNFLGPYAALLQSKPENAEPQVMEMLDIMQRGPTEFKGFVMEKLYFNFMLSEPLTMEKARVDFAMNGGNIDLKKDVTGLVIPVDLYRHISPEASQFASVYEKALNLSGATELHVKRNEGLIDITFPVIQVEDKELGSVTLDAALTHQGDSLIAALDGEGENQLKKAKAVLVDKRAMEIFLQGELSSLQRYGLNQEGMNSVADLRGIYAGQVLQTGKDMPLPLIKAVTEGLAELVKAPGTLTIVLSPDAPVDLKQMQQLNPSVEFVPAQ